MPHRALGLTFSDGDGAIEELRVDEVWRLDVLSSEVPADEVRAVEACVVAVFVEEMRVDESRVELVLLLDDDPRRDEDEVRVLVRTVDDGFAKHVPKLGLQPSPHC